MKNPFSLAFGNTPYMEIDRSNVEFDIVEDFNSEHSSSNAYMITGVRGSGKTVYMTNICRKLKQDKKWIVIEVSPEEDILRQIAYRLTKDADFGKLVVSAKIDISILNIEISKTIGDNAELLIILLEKMLKLAEKKGKRVAVAIDESINNKYIKEFAHAFQIYIRNDLPIYLIMTGLYENIYEIQNEKTLTFLYRTPRIEMKPLKLYKISDSYADIFDLSPEEAKRMSEMTLGYAFAYQVLGYFYFEKGKDDLSKIENKYCNYLGEYVYEKIWSELSMKDREVVATMIEMGDKIRVKELRDKLGVDSSKFSHYRDRLKRKGVINITDYGYISFSLPYFKEFIKKAYVD